MTRYLLDVNVLIALLDPSHIQHEPAHAWFVRMGKKAWATCPLTQNGVLRIVGHVRYPNSPGTPAAVAGLMATFLAHSTHEFWPDDISLLKSQPVNVAKLLNSGQVTDTYLLALAAAHGGKLATFDRQFITDAVVNGTQAYHCIGRD